MATGALVAASFATDAKAIDVELYGQANKTVISADNGTDSEVTISDNDKSSTRVGLKGEQALDNGLTASVLVEYEMNDNGSDADLNTTTAKTTSALSERHARVGLAGDFGAVFVGRTSTATDGIAEADLAGVSDILGSDITRFGGDTSFVQKSGTTVAVKVDDAFSNFDGDKGNAVVYHSPVLAGFQGQLSTTEAGDIQAAVRYSGKYDAFAIKAGIGYESNNDAAISATALESTFAGSVSVKHDSGLAGTVAFGSEERESGAEASSVYVKVGYAWDAFEIAADYSKHEADDAANTEGEAYGFGGQYNLGHGVSLAGGYRSLGLDKDATTYDDIDLIMANLRVKF